MTSLRRLLAVLAALALLWAPLALQTGAAMAMAPVDRAAQAMAAGHCDHGTAGEPTGDQPGHAAGKPCCAAMCLGIEAPPVAATEARALIGTPELPATRPGGPGFLADLPTPPPRRA